MNALTISIALMTLLCGATQDSTLEIKAVIRVQQTLASQYDPALPARAFGNWFNQTVGPQAGVTWHLTECIERAGSTAAGSTSDGELAIPACVEVTAILPDERKVVVQILAGTLRQGLAVKTKFHFAVIEDDDQFRSVPILSDLPKILRMVFPKTRLKTIALPRVRISRPPQLFVAKPFQLIDPPKELSVETIAETPPPPPRPGAPLKISKGVTPGDAIVRVTPVYPTFARQINASGEVQVEVTIDEGGRVVNAKAVSGHPMLRLAAEEAARKWVFKQTLLDGKLVKQQTVLTFVFALPQ